MLNKLYKQLHPDIDLTVTHRQDGIQFLSLQFNNEERILMDSISYPSSNIELELLAYLTDLKKLKRSEFMNHILTPRSKINVNR